MPVRSLTQIVAEKIEGEFCKTPGQALPPVRSMASHFEVSLNTVCNALFDLKNRGVIEGVEKRRYRVKADEKKSVLVNSESDASMHLYKKIIHLISNDHFRYGEPLPKLDYFIREFNLSRHLVRNVLNNLVDENYLYRQGKNWVVGPLKSNPVTRAYNKAPVVGVILSRTGGWSHLKANVRTWGFYDSFIREAEKYGYIIQLYGIMDPWTHKYQKLSTKIKSIVTETGQFGNRFAGFLVIGRNKEDFPINEIITLLIHGNQRAAWLDDNGHNPSGIAPSPNFLRLHYSNLAMAKCTAQYIIEQGHEEIVYCANDSQDWEKERYQQIAQELEQYQQDVKIHLQVENEWHWFNPVESGQLEKAEWVSKYGSKDVIEAFQEISRSRAKTLKDFEQYEFAELDKNRFDAFFILMRAFLKGKLPSNDTRYIHMRRIGAAISLQPVFKNRNVTLVITPNDIIANQKLLPWIGFLKIKIPQKFSILSFDNQEKGFVIPLNSIDPGFDELGFKAFHWLSQLIPQKLGQQKSLASEPRVVNRGSVLTLK